MAEQGGDAAANTREVRDPVWERCPRAQLRQVGAFPRALSRLESEHRVCPAWAYESLRPTHLRQHTPDAAHARVGGGGDSCAPALTHRCTWCKLCTLSAGWPARAQIVHADPEQALWGFKHAPCFRESAMYSLAIAVCFLLRACLALCGRAPA